MKLSKDEIRELLLAAGFRIFKDMIVAADGGNSGQATECGPKLIELTIQKIAEKNTHKE